MVSEIKRALHKYERTFHIRVSINTSSGATNCTIPFASLISRKRPIRCLVTLPEISTKIPLSRSLSSPQLTIAKAGGGGGGI